MNKDLKKKEDKKKKDKIATYEKDTKNNNLIVEDGTLATFNIK